MSEERVKWELEKIGNNKLKVSPITTEFDDAYNKIHLKDYYLLKYDIPGSCIINSFVDEEGLKDFENLFNEVNLFKPREEIPVKRIDWSDDTSSSVLIRKCGRIEIARRTNLKLNSTINIIPISDGLKDGPGFFGQCAKYLGPEGEIDRYGRHHYYLEEGQPEYDNWSRWMDDRYYSKIGKSIKSRGIVNKHIKPDKSPQLEKVLLSFQNTKPNYDKNIIIDLLERGYIKINNNKTSIYNKYGYWLGRFEEFKDSSILIAEAISWLSVEELNICKLILDKYLF